MSQPMTFDDFLKNTTEHYTFMLTELKKEDADGEQLLDEWLARIVDMRNELKLGDYLDFMLGSIGNLNMAFKETAEKFPNEYVRVGNIARLMWQISDELRIKLGEIQPIEPRMTQEELIEKGKALKVALFAFMKVLEEGFGRVIRIIDRNVIIQWAGIYYYNYYGFQSLTLVQPGQTQQIKDQFEVIVRKIFSRCPTGN